MCTLGIVLTNDISKEHPVEVHSDEMNPENHKKKSEGCFLS
jgi:hypothetical protein